MRTNQHGRFKPSDAAKIVKVTKTYLRRPINPGLAERRYPIGAGGGSGTWAQITGQYQPPTPTGGTAPAVRYSWVPVVCNADGTVTQDTSGAVDASTASSGYALEMSGLKYVPPNALVFLTTAPGGAVDSLVFRYSNALIAVTRRVTTYPNTPNCWYGITPSNLNTSGPSPVEGQTGFTTTGSTLLYAWNNGTAVPPSGSAILAYQVTPGRFVFHYP